MAPVTQLYGLTAEEARRMTPEQADALYQAAYQAYVASVGTGAFRTPDPKLEFSNMMSASATELRSQLARPLDSALQSVMNLRLRA